MKKQFNFLYFTQFRKKKIKFINLAKMKNFTV